MNKRFLSFLFSLLFLLPLFAQITPREEISILCSDEFAGRGYVEKGDAKAATYIHQEFEKAGLKAFNGNYYQSFFMQVNTFPGKMELEVDGKTLEPGTEYLIKATSSSAKGKFTPVFIGLKDLESDSAFNALKALDWKNKIPVVDTMTYEGEKLESRYKFLNYNGLRVPVMIFLSKNNLIWTVGREQANFAVFELKPGFITPETKEIKLRVEAKLVEKHATQNVIAYVPGTEQKDSFIVFTAHYDHLGKMGKNTIFPGANDNASGTSMILSLARYYAANPQPYSICFMAFAGEEAGLVGSRLYTENPVFPLENIRFLLNLDLVGSGNKGITVVNATEFEEEFNLLKEINAKDSLLLTVDRRGKAANSDHFWFSEKGVRAFFIYQMGDYFHYHDPGDKADILPLTHYAATEELIKKFVGRIQE